MERILKNINKAALKFLEPLTIAQTYSLIIEEAVVLLRADYGLLYVADGRELLQVSSYPSDFSKHVVPRKRGYTYKAFSQNKTFILNGRQILEIHPELTKRSFGSAICIPLANHGKSLGSLLVVAHEEQRFAKDALHLLKVFGAYASLAIRKAQLYTETKQAIETRDLFISLAAHELRTPLTTIKGYVHLLEKKITPAFSNEGRWMHQLAWETQRLSNIVNELLEVNKVKNGQLHYVWKECSLKEIINRAMIYFSYLHPRRNVMYIDKTSEGKDVVIGDFDQLLQVITSVLDNAAKFSFSHTDVLVTLSARARSIAISVKDKGTGMEKKDAQKIFDKFYRDAKNEEGGIGLGLYLAKNIVKMHHGKIAVKTKLGKGTSIDISLPKARNP